MIILMTRSVEESVESDYNPEKYVRNFQTWYTKCLETK